METRKKGVHGDKYLNEDSTILQVGGQDQKKNAIKGKRHSMNRNRNKKNRK